MVLDFCRAMQDRKAARPVIVAIASPGMTVNTTEDGPDGPAPATRTVGADVNPSSPGMPLVVDALRRSHTTFYVLHIDTYSARGVDNQPPVVHYSWPVDAPSQTGGRTDRLVTVQGLKASLERVADELLAQDAATYQSVDGASNVPLSIGTKRKGVSVFAPQRVYDDPGRTARWRGDETPSTSPRRASARPSAAPRAGAAVARPAVPRPGPGSAGRRWRPRARRALRVAGPPASGRRPPSTNAPRPRSAPSVRTRPSGDVSQTAEKRGTDIRTRSGPR